MSALKGLLKLCLVFLLLTTYYLLLTTPVHAQSPAPSASPLPPTTYSLPATILPTSPLYTDLLVHNLFHTFSCLAVGSSFVGQPCLTYQLTQNAQGAIRGVPVLSQTNLSGGVLGTTSSLIGMLYQNPPVRTADYLASVGESLGFAKEAHAQVTGSGANVLRPVETLWKVSRNIAYVVMIIIFVIIGLMVMFRQRINPQTVITAQAALPGLIIGLILITFSYFLAGLVSDSAFVGTNLVGAYFSAIREDSQPQNLVKELAEDRGGQGGNVLTIFSKYAGIIEWQNTASIVGSIFDQLDTHVQNVLRGVATLMAMQITLPLGNLGGGVGQLISSAISAIAINVAGSLIIGFVLSAIAIIILIYAMLRLLLRLINAYLQIIFLTITAPFQFLAAALPGRQGIATNWILNMLAHALAFPAVLAVLYFVAFILGKPSGPLRVTRVSDAGAMINDGLITTAAAQEPVVRLVGDFTFPLFGGMSIEFVRILLAFGALVALPAIPDIITRTIGRVGVAGQLLGEEYGRGVAGGRGYYNQVAGAPGGFAERIGDVRDQPLRYFEVERDSAGKAIPGSGRWVEKWEPVGGIGQPTQGRWSRITSSTPWQKTIGRFGRAIKGGPPAGAI